LLQDAIEKKHSTTSEAIESGKKMNAYRVILNHFSQRYPKIPVFSTNYNEKTCIAFDLMKIDFDDLKDLPKMNDALKHLFTKEELEQD
jgi:ribonuclease Z